MFTIAAIWGVLVLAPMYFMERLVGQERPPAIIHAEFFYGLIGVALAFQVAFFIIGRDPVRRRPLMESEINWIRGGSSIYFRDPDGNLVA